MSVTFNTSFPHWIRQATPLGFKKILLFIKKGKRFLKKGRPNWAGTNCKVGPRIKKLEAYDWGSLPYQ